MSPAASATLVIACPQCGTRYRLTREQLGAGREVQCANCPASWHAQDGGVELTPPQPAEPDEDRLFDAAAEANLDAAFAAEAASAAASPGVGTPVLLSSEEIKRAIAPRPKQDKAPDPAVLKKRMAAYSRRQDSMMRRLPLGRFRHTARIVGMTALFVLVGGGVVWRTGIVQQVPDLAGVYAALGLAVNVVGLEFSEVRTLEMLRDGAPVLIVNARIVGAADHKVPVPPVVVTLLGQAGTPVYEWSVKPPAGDLGPGEAIAFETRLTQPPANAARVRLSFANQRAQPDAAAPAPQAEEKQD